MDREKMLWSRVETVGFVRGRPVTSYYSFHTPITTRDVRLIDAKLVAAFGNNSRTVATPYEG